MAKLIPAILTDNLEDLQEKLKFFEKESNVVQIDISDGVYVKNKTLDVSQANLAKTAMEIEWHLMVENPALEFLKISHPKTKIVTFQVEVNVNVEGLINRIKSKDYQAGLAVNPNTPISEISKYLDFADEILILGVPPGFQGQTFIPETLDKIKELRKIYSGIIEVDGGIKTGIALKVKQAGADRIVVGSGILKAEDPKKEFEKLKKSIGE